MRHIPYPGGMITPSPESDVEFGLRLLGSGIAAAHAHEHGNTYARTDYEFCTVEAVLEGEGMLSINGTQHHLRAGDVYILHRHSTHKYHPAPGAFWRKVWFVVKGPLADQLWHLYRLDTTYVVHRANVTDLLLDMHRLVHENKTPSVHRDAAILFHRMVSQLSIKAGAVTHRPEPVSRALNFIEQHLEHKVDLDDICRAAGRSRSWLNQAFKTHFNVAPYEYLIRRRMEVATFLLRNTALPVKVIAARLQFADAFYFSGFFKRRYGASPRAFRRNDRRST